MNKTKTYLNNLVDAMRQSQYARLRYFPMNRKEREKMNRAWGHSIGYGLTEKDDLGSLYSTLLVQFSIDSIGVALSCKEFIATVRSGIMDAAAFRTRSRRRRALS